MRKNKKGKQQSKSLSKLVISKLIIKVVIKALSLSLSQKEIKAGNATRCNNRDDLLHFRPIYNGDLYITQSNIYNGIFIAKIISLNIFTKKLHRRCSNVLTLRTFYFFKVFYIIRLLKSIISLKCFTSFSSSNMLLVLLITCLGGRFGTNCPSAFLKLLKLPQ